MRTVALALGVTLLLAAGQAAVAEDKEKTELAAEKLVGGYTMVAGERGGDKLSEDKLKGNIVRFTKDRIVTTD